jgi:hypothetical protein
MDAADVPEQMDASDVPVGAKVKFVVPEYGPWGGSGRLSKGTVVGIKTKATVQKFLQIDEYDLAVPPTRFLLTIKQILYVPMPI